MEALGRRATFVQCDVRRRSLTDAAVLDAVKKMGTGPDILVASAGGWRAGCGRQVGYNTDLVLPRVKHMFACCAVQLLNVLYAAHLIAHASRRDWAAGAGRECQPRRLDGGVLSECGGQLQRRTCSLSAHGQGGAVRRAVASGMLFKRRAERSDV